MERTRKQHKPERAPGSLEILGKNCQPEKEEVVAKKRGRKPKKKEQFLESENDERQIGEEEKEIEENNGNAVSQKEESVQNEGGISGNGVSEKEVRMQNEGGISKVGEGYGNKAKKSEVDAGKKGVVRNNNKGNLTGKGGKKNNEKERLEHVAGEIGESFEEKESGVSEDKKVLEGYKRVKLDEDCQVTGEEVFSVKEEDGNGLSVNEKGFGDLASAVNKRLRDGGKKKRGRGGRTGMQKRMKLMAAQENGDSDQEDNGVNPQKHDQKDRTDDEFKENEGLGSEEKQSSVLEEEGGEGNKVRGRGPKSQGKKLREETRSVLGNEKEENDLRPYSLRTSTKQVQHVSKDSKKGKIHVRLLSCLV